MPYIVLTAAIVGSLGAIIALYLGRALIRWVGSWLGGRGASQDIRVAMAWSHVPVICVLTICYPLKFLLFGQELFTTERPFIIASSLLTDLLLLFTAIKVAVYFGLGSHF